MTHSFPTRRSSDLETPLVTYRRLKTMIHADLSGGVNVTAAHKLQSNVLLSSRGVTPVGTGFIVSRSEEHTSELRSLMRISYAVFCLKNKTTPKTNCKAPDN